MRKLAVLVLAVALVGIALAFICRIRFAPVAGLSAEGYLMGAQTALLLVIALLLMEKK
jgi:hypothetical protein